jgi:membrane protein DedA with SNARE-associated domain
LTIKNGFLIDIPDLITIFNSFGYTGIFLVSFIGSIIPFVPIPYFPILVIAAIDDQLDPSIISISSAVGAVMAKLIIFYASFYGRKALKRKTKKRMYPLQLFLAKYGWIGAFVAALTPIPDDIVFIPLGLAKYSPWKFAIATFGGKFILNEIIVFSSIYFGRPFLENISSFNGYLEPYLSLIGLIGGITILAVVIYLWLKIDWYVIIGRWFPWAIEETDRETSKDRKRNSKSDSDDDNHHQNQ